MAKQNIGIPKGTRDFTPEEMTRRNYIFGTIRNVFEKYGYLPIETPAMENIESLTGKYGDEGDQLLFKILNSRPHDARDEKKQAMAEAFQKSLKENSNSPLLTEKALRYDLTVPFARFVVQHQNEIQFPFKRYQIQPVWRADRPQKGRYREFYQCDADVVGSTSLFNEVELIQMLDEVFSKLGISVTIKLNNRKILAGIAEIAGEPERIIDLTISIDKLDKIGFQNVIRELLDKGFQNERITKILSIIMIKGTNESKLEILRGCFEDNHNFTGQNGVNEIITIFNYLKEIKIKSEIQIDTSLARGLNYYTGTIIEVKSNDVQIGSISGGGRYDDLTGIFGMPGVSGVGVSFGADRIYDVLDQLNLFPNKSISTIQVMFVNFGEKESIYCLSILENLRSKGISALLYPENAKMKKQMSYANALNIPFVILAGENEINDNTVTVKNMISGQQEQIKRESLADYIKKNQ